MEIPVDIRLLSATHRNLADMVQTGLFRQDLYYRINVIDLHVPASARKKFRHTGTRRAYIGRLTDANENGSADIIDSRFGGALQHYHFPGNVRASLENILEKRLHYMMAKCSEIDE